jgi:multidrug efflux pump subunit AcrB
MKLAHFFIDHPRFATVINIFIVVIGLACMTRLSIAQYPNIVPTTIQVTTAFPGASAETIARTVAIPLEQAINGVEKMDYITSQSTGDGRLAITVIFKVGTDPNTALMLTRNRVQGRGFCLFLCKGVCKSSSCLANSSFKLGRI